MQGQMRTSSIRVRPAQVEERSSTGGWILNFGNRTLAFDRDSKSGSGLQPFYPYNLALTQKSDGTAGPSATHLHRQIHLSMRRDLIVGFQKYASRAYVLADGREFTNSPSARKTQAHWKLKIESAVSSLLRCRRGEVLGLHKPILALDTSLG